MNTDEVKQHQVIKMIAKKLEELNYAFTFESNIEGETSKATGLFRLYNLACPVLIKCYFEKSTKPVVRVNGKDISDRHVRELPGLIAEAVADKQAAKGNAFDFIDSLHKVLTEEMERQKHSEDLLKSVTKIPPFSEFVNRTFQNTGIRMFPETQDTGNYIEPVKTIDTGRRSDLIGALLDGYLSNPEASDHSLKYVISRAFLIEQRDWEKHMMGADTAEFKYTAGQDVKLLPSGKVCTFVQYIDKHKEYCPYCVIRAYGSSSGLTTVKLTDIEPWYVTPTLFKGDERVKNLRSLRSGKLVAGPFKTNPGVAWVLFDDAGTPERVELKFLEKLSETDYAKNPPAPAPVSFVDVVPNWKKGDSVRVKGTQDVWTFIEFGGTNSSKSLVHFPTTDKYRRWILTEYLEKLPEEKKLPDWVKGDILSLRGTDKLFTFSEFNVSGDKAIVERDGVRSWQRISELELYTAKRSEPKVENAAQAERKNDGKLEWSLVDFDALEPMVLGLMKGAQKYSRDNWKKGLHTSKIMESLMRHYTAIMRGELIDAETGVPHIGLLMCNAMFFSWTVKNKPELNDL